MKKIINMIVLAMVLLSLSGCSAKEDTDKNEHGKDIISSDVVDNSNNKDNALEDVQESTQEANEDFDSEINTDIKLESNIDDNKESNPVINHLSEPMAEDDQVDIDYSLDEELSSIPSDSTSNQVDAKNISDTDKKGTSTKQENDNSKSNKKTDEASESSDEKLSELGLLSKKLGLQMSKGDFKQTYDTLSPRTKLQLTIDALEKGWNDTVADMGAYNDIRSIREETIDANRVVYVILDYDHSGIQILFSYNSNNKLDGLWLNYAPYDVVNGDDSIEDLTISFGDRKNPIDGILTLPKAAKKPPLVILVHGSGNHDADETIGNNKPFRDIAHGLGKKGIAVVRYKESGLAKNNNEFTIQDDSLNDVAQAIKYALSCGKVNTDKIYIVGHSLGGMLAPKIATDNSEVAGIVILAGSPRRLEDIILDQNRIQLKADKSINEAMYKLYMAQVTGEVNKVKAIKEGSSDIILGYPSSYWYSLNQIDIAKIAKELDIPIFIAQGSEDFQVYADIDYVAWQELLKDKDNISFRLYDNLNHLFMTSNGRMDITEYNIKGTVDQKVIDDIAKWILKK